MKTNRLFKNTRLFRHAPGLRSFPIAVGIIATYGTVRLIPLGFARPASGYFEQPGENCFCIKTC
jgi:hypothetical protein